MSVLAAVREREARRIVEPRRRAVHDLGDERQRLQRARAELLEQQERREVAQLALVGERQHGAEPPLVHVARGGRRGAPASRGAAPRRACAAGSLARDGRAAPPAPAGAAVHQVADRPGGLADDGRVRIGDEVADGGRVPVIAAGQAARLVHALLHDRPVAVGGRRRRRAGRSGSRRPRRCCRSRAVRRLVRTSASPSSADALRDVAQLLAACSANAVRGRRRRRCRARARAGSARASARPSPTW